jgi:hypothetical protein
MSNRYSYIVGYRRNLDKGYEVKEVYFMTKDMAYVLYDELIKDKDTIMARLQKRKLVWGWKTIKRYVKDV